MTNKESHMGFASISSIRYRVSANIVLAHHFSNVCVLFSRKLKEVNKNKNC